MNFFIFASCEPLIEVQFFLFQIYVNGLKSTSKDSVLGHTLKGEKYKVILLLTWLRLYIWNETHTPTNVTHDNFPNIKTNRCK